MKKQFFLIILFNLLAALAATAQTATVEYLEGIVEVSNKTGWEMVNFGDTLPLTAKVKVAKNSLIELAYGDIKINITRAGLYTLQDLTNSQKQVSSWKLSSVIDWKVKQLAGTSEGKTQSTTMGVRGAKTDEKNIEWMYIDDDSREPGGLQQGELLVQAGKYKEASALLEELLKKGVTQEEEPYVRYYLAYADTANVKQIAALKQIDKVQVKADHPLYDALLLLKGQLLIDTLAFKEALDMFNAYLNTNSKDETAQSVLILSAYCYKGLNNTSEQKKSLTKAEKLAPDSPLGKEAQRLLNEMKG